jgi:hypothetical protein
MVFSMLETYRNPRVKWQLILLALGRVSPVVPCALALWGVLPAEAGALTERDAERQRGRETSAATQRRTPAGEQMFRKGSPNPST